MKEVQKEVLEKTETKNKSFQVPELIEMLQAGAHFGHKKSAWNPQMKKYIYEERNGIHIIDLVKTRELLEDALNKLSYLSEKGSVLIVGTKGQAASIVQSVAEKNGMFYINRRWPGGLFTNFDVMKKSIQGLIKMEDQLARGAQGLVKKEVLLMEREVERLNRIYQGIKFMDKLPEVMIVVDTKVEENAIKEARAVGIPVVALLDTNCNPDIVDYPIPANDDSLKSISMFVDILGEVVGQSKKALSVISLRKDQEAMLAKLSADFEAEKERVAKMENEDRERMKSLREGKVQAESTSSVVRVVKKEKDINAEIEAAEKAKQEADSKSIQELGLSERVVKSLMEAGIDTISKLRLTSKEELLAVKGIGAKAVDEILKSVK
ncbi:30S ribosomal protein S2 [Candidatus Microgenomates bacterium]|nr:30S ribosomal protein S2 [Candidatus Microgenomates bacterium]